MTSTRFIVLFIAAWLLSACGFHPMYGETGATASLSDEFANVAISPIEERTGQIVWNHLRDRMNPHGEPAAPDYLLSVDLNEIVEGYGYRQDESVTRESFTLEAMFRLTDQKTGDVVYADKVRSVQAYDVVQSDFANFSAQQDARDRTALQVSELITARLGLYFKSHE